MGGGGGGGGGKGGSDWFSRCQNITIRTVSTEVLLSHLCLLSKDGKFKFTTAKRMA